MRMDRNSGDRRFKLKGTRPFRLSGFLLIVLLLVIFSLSAGCQKKEKGPSAPPATGPKAREAAQTRAGEQKAPETPGQSRAPNFHSVLTKDLNRPAPATSFSQSDRIYLVTVWTGLQGAHAIKVLWLRPDKTVQETVRLNENIPSKPTTYTTWAYLSFTKGLLNLSPSEGKFIGSWKAQLYLDGNLLQEYDFSVS